MDPTIPLASLGPLPQAPSSPYASLMNLLSQINPIQPATAGEVLPMVKSTDPRGGSYYQALAHQVLMQELAKQEKESPQLSQVPLASQSQR